MNAIQNSKENNMIIQKIACHFNNLKKINLNYIRFQITKKTTSLFIYCKYFKVIFEI